MLAATDERPRLPTCKDARMSATSMRTADKMPGPAGPLASSMTKIAYFSRTGVRFPGPGCEEATSSVRRAADPLECQRPLIQPAQICEATADDSRAHRLRSGVLGGRRWPLRA